jgi:hypothetical protein
MHPCVTCERGVLLSYTSTDIIIVFKKSNIAWWKYIPPGTPGGPREKHQYLRTRLHRKKKANGAMSIGVLGFSERSAGLYKAING